VIDQLENMRDNLRRSEANPLSKLIVTDEREGDIRLSADVSPCSWLNHDYGLQIQVTMAGGGNVCVIDKAVKFADATEADVRRLLAIVRTKPCSRCGKTAFDPESVRTNRQGLCEQCFMADLTAEFDKATAKEKKRMAKADAKYRATGHTHRVDAWIHTGGGDQPVSFYFKGSPRRRPSRISSKKRVRGS